MNYDQEWAPEDILHFSIVSAPVLSGKAEVLQSYAAKFVSDDILWAE